MLKPILEIDRAIVILKAVFQLPLEYGEFTGSCSLNRDTPIELAKPDDSSRLRFYGGTLGDGIIASKNTSYYTETGEVCENNDSPKCNIAVQASLKAVCVNTTECGANGPDLLKITVEIKDNRKETKVAGSNARSVNWAQKPSIYKFYTVHDLTHLKQVANADLQANGCPSLDGDPGYPLGLRVAKLSVAITIQTIGLAIRAQKEIEVWMVGMAILVLRGSWDLQDPEGVVVW